MMTWNRKKKKASKQSFVSTEPPLAGKLYQVITCTPSGMVTFGKALAFDQDPTMTTITMRSGTWALITRVYSQEEMLTIGFENPESIPPEKQAALERYMNTYIWVDILYEEKVHERAILRKHSWEEDFFLASR